MRIGCSIHPGKTELIQCIKDSGYDFVEIMYAPLESMSDKAYDDFCGELYKNDIKCEAVNVLFPSGLRLTGPDFDLKKIDEYLKKMLFRTKNLGFEVAIFGSGGARRVPDGFPMEEAYRQLKLICRELLQPYCEEYHFTIGLESLNRGESNILNKVSEAYEMAKVLNLPRIQIMCDGFHMALENESFADIKNYGNSVIHAHIANPVNGRHYPKSESEYPYSAFIDGLRSCGYDRDGKGRLCAEVFVCDDFERDIALCAKFLRTII